MRKPAPRFPSDRFLLFVALAVVSVSLAGCWPFPDNHATNGVTKPSGTPGLTDAGTITATVAYLDIKEWGIKLPLSDGIKDAYYVVSNSSQDSATGQPNTVWLGLMSLNRTGCDASLADVGQDTQLGAIVRLSPTVADPISGTPYSQLYPGGITVGAYYYAYSSWSSNRTCAPKERLQQIDAAFSAAIRRAVADATK